MAASELEQGTFERLSPSRFLSFSFPNPAKTHPNPYTDLLRIAVLDSPLPTTQPKLAAMLVPIDREDDWIFSTDHGHLQLLLNSSPDLLLSRLVLVGNPPAADSSLPIYTRPKSDPDPVQLQRFQQTLFPLLLALSPKAAFRDGFPEIPFLSFDDDVIRSVPVEKLLGPVVGEMLVEDVEIDQSPAPPEFRRRLRFKRMPNLVQTQVRLVPDSSIVGMFRPDTDFLVQPYLEPMAASLSLIAPCLEEQVRLGLRPRALCVGVGGGALLMFLQSRLGFDVLGVEVDNVVLSAARRHFGLVEGEFLRVCAGDGIEFIECIGRGVAIRRGSKSGWCLDSESDESEAAGMGLTGDHFDGFDAIMVDLDSGDGSNGLSAPPVEFIQKSVLFATKSVLLEHGILVVNVIPTDGSFYNGVIDTFRKVFSHLYELDVGNGENFVLIATASPVKPFQLQRRNAFSEKLKLVVGERYVDCIRKI